MSETLSHGCRSPERNGGFTTRAQIIALLCVVAGGAFGCATAQRRCTHAQEIAGKCGVKPAAVMVPAPGAAGPSPIPPENPDRQGPEGQCRTERGLISSSEVTTPYKGPNGSFGSTTHSAREYGTVTLCPDPLTGEMVKVTDEIFAFYQNRFAGQLGLDKYPFVGSWSADGKRFISARTYTSSREGFMAGNMALSDLLMSLMPGQVTESRSDDGNTVRKTRKSLNMNGADLAAARAAIGDNNIQTVRSPEGLFEATVFTVTSRVRAALQRIAQKSASKPAAPMPTFPDFGQPPVNYSDPFGELPRPEGWDE